MFILNSKDITEFCDFCIFWFLAICEELSSLLAWIFLLLNLDGLFGWIPGDKLLTELLSWTISFFEATFLLVSIFFGILKCSLYFWVFWRTFERRIDLQLWRPFRILEGWISFPLFDQYLQYLKLMKVGRVWLCMSCACHLFWNWKAPRYFFSQWRKHWNVGTIDAWIQIFIFMFVLIFYRRKL